MGRRHVDQQQEQKQKQKQKQRQQAEAAGKAKEKMFEVDVQKKNESCCRTTFILLKRSIEEATTIRKRKERC